MSDPRQEERQRIEAEPTQLTERVKLGLSPCDDEMPFAQAVRHKEEIGKAVASYRKHRKE